MWPGVILFLLVLAAFAWFARHNQDDGDKL